MIETTASDAESGGTLATINADVPEVSEALVTHIPKKRELVMKRPGNINWATKEGSYVGCRIIRFTEGGECEGLESEDLARFLTQRGNEAPFHAIDAMNLYFKHRANLLTVAIIPSGGEIICVFTNQLDEEEVAEFNKWSQLVSEQMETYREEKAKKQAEVEAAKAASAKEERELLKLGRVEKAEGFSKRALTAEDEVRKLKKEVDRLKYKLKEK